MKTEVVLLCLAAPFLVVGIWASVCWLISVISGWGKLAQTHTSREPDEGLAFRMASAKFRGFANYNRCLTVHASSIGLRFEVWPIFRMGHPPLFFAWDEIREISSSRFLGMDFVTFRVSGKSITILQKLWDKVITQRPAPL